ncbi:uncharacterized protein N0V89_005657 [Didymosphaeria variabile]|uniref:SET domain-containing protein n=1 Tax=Didymosphaeria variabile TaxID=1932322 RepID=A0A9W8XLF4_9PLEO|nr:uncharacterized protein N0V89_005657 [Didymosphaeria variabile]KAJ4353926.1 hypothetical protein N0V89_005657 [Didymosphaeria variabile]
MFLRVRDVLGKGKGIFATQPILKGTCILSEIPILTVPASPSLQDIENLCLQVANLPDEQRQAFEALSSCHPYDSVFTQYLNIVRTNSFSVRDGAGGICLNASRINHACNSNAQHTWNDSLGKVTVYALRDVAENEEITTNYMGRGRTRQERQAYLQKIYKFDCACELCSLPAALNEAADQKILRARKLWSYFQMGDGHTRHLANPLQRLRRLEEVARHWAELGSSTQIHDTNLEAAALALSHSDVARGNIFFGRAYASYVLAHGDNDPTARDLRARSEVLTRSACYGQSTRWQTSRDDVPRDDIPGLLETWLWKKEEDLPKTSLFADLQDRSTFLGIGGLPTEGRFDLEYHQDASTGQSNPKRHWCFMGEIKDKVTLKGQLQLMVKDIDDHVTGIFFHDRNKGAKVSQFFNKNETVVVLYAQRGESDVRPVVKVRGTSVIKICQMTGWKDKNHKIDCKMLKNADVRVLFTFKWHDFKVPVRFPLSSLDDKVERLADKAGNMAV